LLFDVVGTRLGRLYVDIVRIGRNTLEGETRPPRQCPVGGTVLERRSQCTNDAEIAIIQVSHTDSCE